MKNMTITLDEEVADWARIRAAKCRSSVSRLVGEILKQKMQEEAGYQVAMNQFLSRGPVPLKMSGSYPSKNEIHER
jgi:plasmid stability protein